MTDEQQIQQNTDHSNFGNWLAILQLKTTDLRLLNPISMCIVH